MTAAHSGTTTSRSKVVNLYKLPDTEEMRAAWQRASEEAVPCSACQVHIAWCLQELKVLRWGGPCRQCIREALLADPAVRRMIEEGEEMIEEEDQEDMIEEMIEMIEEGEEMIEELEDSDAEGVQKIEDENSEAEVEEKTEGEVPGGVQKTEGEDSKAEGVQKTEEEDSDAHKGSPQPLEPGAAAAACPGAGRSNYP